MRVNSQKSTAKSLNTILLLYWESTTLYIATLKATFMALVADWTTLCKKKTFAGEVEEEEERNEDGWGR